MLGMLLDIPQAHRLLAGRLARLQCDVRDIAGQFVPQGS